MHRAVSKWSGSGTGRSLTGLFALVLAGLLVGLVPGGSARGEPEKPAPPAKEAPTEPEKPDNPEIFRREGPDPAPPLSRDLLSKVADGRPLPTISGKFDRHGKITQGTAKEALEEDEAFAFVQVLITAHQAPVEAFAVSARRDLAYVNLFKETALYRGEVVHVEGRMRRLVRYTPPAGGVAAGMRAYYEGWIFNPDLYGPSAAVCVLFTELPEGLDPAEKMDKRVAFDGYLFKRYAYQSGDVKAGKHREAPLLIGHAPIVKEDPAELSPTATFGPLMYAVLIFFGVAILGVILLGWWLQRGDRQMHHRLADASARRFVEEVDENNRAAIAAEPVPMALPVNPDEKSNGNGHPQPEVRSQKSEVSKDSPLTSDF
jgi:hypothetical protein